MDSYKKSIMPLGMFVFFLVFPIPFNNYSLGFLAIWWIATKQYVNLKKIFKRPYVWLFFLYYMFVLLGLSYTPNVENAKPLASITLGFLAFPILISSILIDKNKLEKIFEFFIAGVFIYTLYLLIKAAKNVISNGSFFYFDPIHPTWKYYYFQYTRLSPDLSPIYLSLYIVIAILLSLALIEQKSKWKNLLITLIFYFVILSFLLSSRIGLISLAVCMIIYFPLSLKLSLVSAKNVVLAIALISFTLLFFNSGFEKRIKKTLPFFTSEWESVAQINNSSGKRAQLYLISTKIIKQNYLYGLGSGASSEAIPAYYDKYFKSKFSLYVKGMNSHNQYFESIISWGILGFVITTSPLIILFIIAVRQKSWAISVIPICFGIFMLGESILVVQKGVFIYLTTILITLTYFSTTREEGQNTSTNSK